MTLAEYQATTVQESIRQLPLPARIDGPIYTPRTHDHTHTQRLAVIFSDGQDPYRDPVFHELACEWLAKNKPDVLVMGGDEVDFPTLTRHGRNPDHERSVQDCLDSLYTHLRDYVSAAGPLCSERYYLEGNHEMHMRREIVARIPELYGVRRAGEEYPALSIPHLLRLDELGISYLGNYPHGALALTPDLMVRHGWVARGRSGASALGTLDSLACNVVVGHTHRAGITYSTTWDAAGNPVTLCAIETGTMATLRGGLGYAPAPNWQNAFLALWLYPDGSFTASHARYQDGKLYWHDQVFTA